MTRKAEAIVVGGGIIGTSVAFHLAQLGMEDVLLLEREHIASGSTGKSVGMVETVYSTDVNVAMAQVGYEELRRFREITGHTADFQPRAYLEAIRREEDRGYLEESRTVGRRHGLHQQILEPDGVQEAFPELQVQDITAGLFSEEAGFCDPHSVATGYAEAAKRRGVTVLTGVRADRVILEAGKVVGVQAGEETFRAPVVVNAAGPWANDLNRTAGFELPLSLWQRQIFVTTPHPQIPADRPMFIDITGRFYFRQELDGGFVLGLVEDTSAKDLANPETDWDFKIKAVEAAVHRVPKLAEVQVARGWSGIVTFTPDQLPVVGPVKEAEGLYLANGLSGYGVMISPAVGLILAEMILRGESKTIDASPLGYERFRSGQQVKSAGLWLSKG